MSTAVLFAIPRPKKKEAKIASLKELLDKGRLTPDEFDQAKAVVLAEPH